MKCKKHPTYRGYRKPRVECIHCWWIWKRACLWAAHKAQGLASYWEGRYQHARFYMESLVADDRKEHNG